MDFLILFSFLCLPSIAFAEFRDADLTESAGGGPGSIYSFGSGGDVNFDTGALHFTYLKQFAPVDPTDPDVHLKGTDNWTAGVDHQLSDLWVGSLEYDQLRDTSENLSTDGIKVGASYDKYHLSYRFARSSIDETVLFSSASQKKTVPLYGAFIYQSTVEGSVDFELTKHDTLIPDFSYSFFSPDVQAFSQILGNTFAGKFTNFTDTLQSIEDWALTLSYNHEMNEKWSYNVKSGVAHLITGSNLSLELNPGVTLKYSQLLATTLSADYVYIPGSPALTFELEFKFHLQKDEKE